MFNSPLLRRLACILACALPALAQEVVTKETSALRVVDRSGAKVGNYIWGLALPEVGVGNVIFSANPLPYGKESEYTQVGARFDLASTGALYCRAYLPGTTESMVRLIEARNPGFKFSRKFEMVALKEAGASAPKQLRVNTKASPAMMGMSTHWSQYWPKNDYSLDVLGALKGKKGEHALRLSVFLEFDTGKSRTVTELRDGRLITETLPILRDVAVAHGECTLVVP